MEITPVHSVTLHTLLSESKRIVKANYSHFFALSLFFLPLSFSLVITPSLHHHLSGDFFIADLFHKSLYNRQKTVICHLLYILIVYLLALCAIGTISYSTHHVLIGKPVNYFNALKSLTVSFFPLVSTAILAHTLLFIISLTFFLFVGVIVMLGNSLGFVIDYNSIYFMWFSIVVGATLILTIIFFQMNWFLASMVVVVESKWGVRALMRSWYLVKGMRSVSSSLFLYFLIINNGILVSVSLQAELIYLSRDTRILVLFTMLGSFVLMMCLVVSIVANAVLYVDCKAFHGELGSEIIEGFNYITLPSDDEKVPHVVTVVEV